MNNKRILQIIVLILLAVVAWLLWPKLQRSATEQYEEVNVTDFTSCQLAGGQLIDGHPVKCRLSDGREFAEEENPEPDVILETPQYGDLVTSPLTLKGKARGTWFFEANLPVTLKDQDGNILVQKGMMTSENWMTTDYVNFQDMLEFDPGDAVFGVLIIERDNPSGLPEFDAQFAVPVRFN